MALLKEAYFSQSNNFKLRLEYTYTQSQEDNDTTIVETLKMVSLNGYSGGGSANSVTGYIGGTTSSDIVGRASSIGKNATITLGSRTYKITHNNDGSFPNTNYFARIDCAWNGVGRAEVSGTLTSSNISKINRASTWDKSLISIANIEDSFELQLTKYVSDYYNVVEVRNNNNTILVKTINDVVNGSSVTFTTNELNTIYTMDNNGNQLPLRFFLDLKTYTSSAKTTQIGATQRLTCEAYIVNGEPTATYTIVEQDSKVVSFLGSDTSDKIIQNASDLLFTITPSAKNGASISNVKVNDTNATKSGNNYIFSVTNITTGTFNIVVTDSRGLSTPYQVTKSVLEYIATKINSNWTIPRESQTSSNLVLTATIDCYSSTINGVQNTPIVQYSVDNSNWATIPSSSYTFANNKVTISNLHLNNLINYQTSGVFYLKVSDLVSEANDNKDVAVGIYTFAKSDRKVRINGTLEIADRNGQNRKNIMTYIDNKNNYSTTSEQVIGIYNNKPLYRRVITGTKVSGTNLQISASWVSDIDTLVRFDGTLRSLSNYDYPLQRYENSSMYVNLNMNRVEKYISVNSSTGNYSNGSVVITIEYTKTTD